MLVEQELIAQVRPDGCLDLLSAHSEWSHRCGPAGTTAWLALQRQGWDIDLAADELAAQWEVEVASIRCDIEAWLRHFHDAINEENCSRRPA